jgi:hypothetical protein
VIQQCQNEISVQQQFHEWVVVVQEPKLLKFVLGHLVPVLCYFTTDIRGVSIKKLEGGLPVL